jgi:gluconokinase
VFLIIMGVAGSGKTTIGQRTADQFGIPYYEGDAFHPAENIDKMSQGVPLTDSDRAGWLDILSTLIAEKLEAGESGVLACSALKASYRDQLQMDPDRVHFIYLKGDYDLIHSRLAARSDHYMPPDLLRSQFDDLEEPSEVYAVDIDRPLDAIFEDVFSYVRSLGLEARRSRR